MIVGMDFGTTNSGMAVFDGQQVRILPLDPANANPRVLRTALYITNEQAVHIGRSAVDHYYEQNIGRVVKTRKVWIGEIEVYAEDLYYVTDAYAWIDVSEPGRLLLSVKTRLREEDHPGAIVGQYYYALEDLIALYLNVVRVRAEQMLGKDIRRVVLGRPVHFSLDRDHDRLAQGRLLQAAFRAGYEEVYLQYEPIAAALSYEITLGQPENVLVFDFGGGTLDITVMRLGDKEGRQVLATGGIPVAGDVFDRKLTRAKLPKHFGEGSLYGSRQNPKRTPRWIYDAFSDWQSIIELQSQENRRILEDIERTAQRRYQIRALLNLVTSNYGLKMFDEVEMAKRRLSEKRGAQINLNGPDFKVREFVTRGEFERIIHADILAIEAEVQRTVRDSGLQPHEIDAVIRTGGSAQIPVFQEMLGRIFGPEKVRAIDTFSSVTAGLGVYAHHIETGEAEARAFTPADVTPPPQVRGSQPRISQVNLDLMKKRIYLNEGHIAPSASARDHILVLLGDARNVKAVNISAAALQEEEAVSLADESLPEGTKTAVLADLDERLLLLTSVYRFLLTTPRQLLELQSIGMTVADLHRLDKEETFCTLSSWDQIQERELLVLFTTRGFVRGFPLSIMREHVEAPVPLRLDTPLPGLPIAAIAAEDTAELILVSSRGRGWRWPVAELRVTGAQVANCGPDDHIAAGLVTDGNEEILPLTVDGHARRLLTEWIPVPGRPNSRGRSLIARRSSTAGLANNESWVLAGKDLRRIKADQLPLEESTKTFPLLGLDDQQIRAILTAPVR